MFLYINTIKARLYNGVIVKLKYKIYIKEVQYPFRLNQPYDYKYIDFSVGHIVHLNQVLSIYFISGFNSFYLNEYLKS